MERHKGEQMMTECRVFSMNYCFKIPHSANESICQAPARGLGILGSPPGRDLQQSKAWRSSHGEGGRGGLLMFRTDVFLFFLPLFQLRVLALWPKYLVRMASRLLWLISLSRFFLTCIFALFNIRAWISMTAACCAFTVKTLNSCTVKAFLKYLLLLQP